MLTEEDKAALDELAKRFPKWQEHLREFRERHPELPPREVMKKAGFTYRMKKGKLLAAYLKPIFDRVIKGG